MSRFDTHIINITLDEAIAAYERTNGFFFEECRKYFAALVEHYQTRYPGLDMHYYHMYALSTVWVAGHLQGTYEREAFQKRMCGEELKEAV